MPEVLIVAAKALGLALAAAVLLLHTVGLPANWILLALAAAYGLATHWHPVGLWTLLALAALAGLGEGLEFAVGLGYTAKRGATRWGLAGACLGGIAGAMALAAVAPPFGAMLGAFAGSFAGAVLLEYLSQRRLDTALRAGRAAFLGRALGACVKTLCGLWMWGVLAYRILFAA
jgi:uncharacterized protein YqgC (DUF456 family)